MSVIISTYNRSNVIDYTIRSVLAQTFKDWELLIIGDHCTDDTASVVEAFQDARISFVNLPKNYGNQYGPHNEGMALAKGRYFAFLNHDDLWFPDHLATELREIEETGADLVFTIGEVVHEKPPHRLSHAAPNGRYEPYISVPCSVWLFKRELFQEVGPWRAPDTLFNIPSQDWLYRAWKAKKNLHAIPKLTTILIHSGFRTMAYAHRDFLDNQSYFDRISNDAEFREKELTELASHTHLYPRHSFKWSLIQLIKRLIFFAGFNPVPFYSFFLYPGKGGFVKKLKKIRGIKEDEKPSFDPT